MLGGKPKIVVKTQDALFFPDGRKEPPKKLLGNYITIKVLDNAEVKCSPQIPKGYKYYFSFTNKNEIVYCYTNNLTTAFLRKALEVLRGNNNFLLKISPKLGILFLKNNSFVIVGENIKELRDKANLITQGLEYEEVDINDLLVFITPPKKNINLKIVAILIPVLIAGVFIYRYTHPNYQPPPPSAFKRVLSKPQKKQQEMKNIKVPFANTHNLLTLITNFTPSEYAFISDINFSSNEVSLYSFFPLPSFYAQGDFYARKYFIRPVYTLDRATIKDILGNYGQCLNFLSRRFPVIYNSKSAIVFKIDGISTIDNVSNILANLKKCPVEIQGQISYVDLMHRNLSLKVVLHKQAK